MNREEIKQAIGVFRKQLIAAFAEQDKDREFHGERITVMIHGKEHCMCHYASKKEHPTVYFDIHGGGFSWGTMEDGDLFCQMLCEELGYEVYAPEYPLTPEAEYPEPLEWVYDTIAYLHKHAEEYHFCPERMIVGGRSAGGNLAASLCLLAKERGDFQFICQVLDHPWLDLAGIIGNEGRYEGEGSIGMQNLGALAVAYATEEQRKEIYVSPMIATKEQMAGLPPAIIQTCELDCLRQDGDTYAAKLKEAGTLVIHQCYMGVLHGFTQDITEDGQKGREWLVESLRKMEMN